MAAQRQEEDAAGEAFEATLTESESESEDSAEDDDLDIPQYEKHQQSSLDPAGNLTEDDIQQNKEEFQAMMKVCPHGVWEELFIRPLIPGFLLIRTKALCILFQPLLLIFLSRGHNALCESCPHEF